MFTGGREYGMEPESSEGVLAALSEAAVMTGLAVAVPGFERKVGCCGMGEE